VENDFLAELVMNSNRTIAWLGGVFIDGHFSWLDQSYVNYLNWEEGQPDHHEWGDCVGLGSLGPWDDVVCRDYPGETCVCKKRI